MECEADRTRLICLAAGLIVATVACLVVGVLLERSLPPAGSPSVEGVADPPARMLDTLRTERDLLR